MKKEKETKTSPKKKLIYKYKDLDIDYSSLSDVKKKIDDAIKECGDAAQVSFAHQYGYYDEVTNTLRIQYQIEETDNEYLHRLELEKADKKLKLAQEKQQYEKLKAKFDKKKGN